MCIRFSLPFVVPNSELTTFKMIMKKLAKNYAKESPFYFTQALINLKATNTKQYKS